MGKSLMGKNEHRKAVKLYLKAIKLGHVESNYELAEYYFSDNRDLELGIFYLNVAVEKGSYRAKYTLAMNHLNG